ncbi:hypothetical protein LMG29542_02449 [Paraburkholderia humisilvae]|uniref:Uncharacterized protein n=1 Tax=Paraburkholderia humisilvae TaxID=627669 RepID=A0A6J5DL10_9BURK|nr:hypothetical protein LMG29542_02449 [Paraburkholderia humisilvae]
MSAYVRITPDVVFSVDVFPRVDMRTSEAALRRRVSDSVESTVDPRQIDLWGDDTQHAPAPV